MSAYLNGQWFSLKSAYLNGQWFNFKSAYLNGQRFHEGEDPWSLVLRFLNDDGHPDLHEGLGEVHLALSVSRDGQSSYGHVRFLERERSQECPDLNSFS